MSSLVFESFTFANGQTIKNRIVKAAMEENLGAEGNIPGGQLFTLYQNWAQGGAGLLITGNVMVDQLAMTGPGGVALEAETELLPFAEWARAAKENDTKVWMQINHPGRQVYKMLKGRAWAPSAVALDLGPHSKLFAEPRAMTEADINEVIDRFVKTAERAKEAGFDGVQIHAAHGYLLSQFLSPRVNQRTDEWGGSLENRARLLLAIVRHVVALRDESFAVSVKINSADFQRGGFDIDDAKQVVKWLEEIGIDLIEMSGGTYEAPAMQRRTADDRTLSREAYFLEFAAQVAAETELAVMTTGGIKRLEVAEQVLSSGVDLVGIASALAFEPDLPNQWQTNPAAVANVQTADWNNKTLASLCNMALAKRQMRRYSNGEQGNIELSPVVTLLLNQWRMKRMAKQYNALIGG
ncbi:NADH:flavin oxidoreductase/NADH oxidase family protein [Pseudidiomarina taiwanensis]|uniref:2,4-dienoyl-CoA reductase n=1 Tax=Pseudidiomarina taiwanensis TaxID=337250 RepID=A0A432ZFH6_9GAMM|nr:NADH:flavin oxidoreductase/NADH oxidase family protein [Pseudidiomarina taiwanensis]RUO76654.1 2,4-dienoyl-CoA reductase [Pseudidiomarina taiwanensis]